MTMKLGRRTPLEQAEDWVRHWRANLNLYVYDSPEWIFANNQLDTWLDRRRELAIVPGQRT